MNRQDSRTGDAMKAEEKITVELTIAELATLTGWNKRIAREHLEAGEVELASDHAARAIELEQMWNPTSEGAEG